MTTGSVLFWGGAIAVTESISNSPGGSRLISRILPPAIRLWLSTQMDHVEDLVFEIEGRDREILSGHLPGVFLSAQKAIYQGIHLSQVAVKASGIRVNLGQVLRRQPLRLLAPFPVSGDVRLTTLDLNQSLQAPLLGQGLYDFLRLLAESQPEAAHLTGILSQLPEPTILPHYHPSATIGAEGITLRLVPQAGWAGPPIAIATQLTIQEGHRLCLENPHWLVDVETDDKTPLPTLHGFEIDLGAEVILTDCTLQADQLTLAGTIRVLPVEA
jgi:hypothetical protein